MAEWQKGTPVGSAPAAPAGARPAWMQGTPVAGGQQAATTPGPEQDAFERFPFLRQRPRQSIGGSLLQNVLTNFQGAQQGVTPVVRTASDELNFEPAPKDAQDFFNESGKVLNERTMVALFDPAEGRDRVFMRNPDMEEGRLTSVGRLFAPGMLSSAPTRAAGLAGAAPRAPTQAQQMLQAFDTANITPSLPAVHQGGGVSRVAHPIREVPFVGGPIIKGTAQQIDETAAFAGQTARAFGRPSTGQQAGARVRLGIERFMDPDVAAARPGVPTKFTSFRTRADNLYKSAHELFPMSAPVKLDKTTDALREVLLKYDADFVNQLVKNPKVEAMLMGIETGGGQLTVNDVKALRRVVFALGRGQDELVRNLKQSEIDLIYGAMTDDLARAAEGFGETAAKRWGRAEKYYGAGLTRATEALDKYFKADTDEQVFGKVLRAAREGSGGDINSLRALRKSIPDEAWQDLTATIIDQMGRVRPGAADPLTPNNFSAATFITEFSKLSDEGKQLLFNAAGNGAARNQLEALVMAAAGQKNFAKLANPSRSGALGIGAASGAGVVVDPVTTGVLGVLGYATAHMLMSPRVTRVLVNGINAGRFRPVELVQLQAAVREAPDDLQADVANFVNRISEAGLVGPLGVE